MRAQSINLQHGNQKSMGCCYKLLFGIITSMFEGAHVGGDVEGAVTALHGKEIAWFSELHPREQK